MSSIPKLATLCGFLWLGLGTLAAKPKPPSAQLVDVTRLAPQVVVDLRYATANNFTGQVLYPKEARCYLREPVAKALGEVQTALLKEGLSLKLLDCYRPHRVQFKLWEIVHDERYVADPNKGSRHNRGAAVDLTLLDAQGQELVMPTPFDDFSEKAHRSYMQLPAQAVENRAKLQRAMERVGFVGMPTEWWHFDAADWQSHPIDDISFETLAPKQAPKKPASAP